MSSFGAATAAEGSNASAGRLFFLALGNGLDCIGVRLDARASHTRANGSEQRWVIEREM